MEFHQVVAAVSFGARSWPEPDLFAVVLFVLCRCSTDFLPADFVTAAAGPFGLAVFGSAVVLLILFLVFLLLIFLLLLLILVLLILLLILLVLVILLWRGRGRRGLLLLLLVF